MADLEKHALQRDRAFLVRLVVSLSLAIAVGLFIFSRLTDEEVAGCASQAFRNVSELPPTSGHPPE